MADEISGDNVKQLLNSTAVARQPGVSAAALLGQFVLTSGLVMVLNRANAPAAKAPNAAGSIDPLAK